MQKIIFIVGPTASGKSALAIRLAKKFNGEIISADSRQVYRGLEIGSGAVTHKEARGVPHHIIGVASPRRAYTIALFVRDARAAIAAIARRGRVPIVAGGTAFWVNTLAYGMTLPKVKPNARMRRALEKKSPAHLLAILKRLDPRRAAAIEQKNPRRLIRAIEVARALGRVPTLVKHSMFDTLWLGLHPPDETLSQRIRQRTDHMIRRGLAPETKKLLAARNR
ncbi:MAG: tRNA (adenosine(37)-N6)-dimethylallyltransferase MiaA, partial [Patescibacteria group bacterium]